MISHGFIVFESEEVWLSMSYHLVWHVPIAGGCLVHVWEMRTLEQCTWMHVSADLSESCMSHCGFAFLVAEV